MDRYSLEEEKKILQNRIEQIDEILNYKEGTINALHFRGNTIGDGEECGNYELFDKLFVLSDGDLQVFLDSDKDNIMDVLWDTIKNDQELSHSNLIDEMYSIYDVDYFDKEKTDKYFPCSLYATFGHDMYNHVDITMKILELPLSVYSEHKDIYIHVEPIDKDC